MLDPNRPPKKDDTSPAANVVAAVLLTIFAIPVLLIAGCMPAVALAWVIPNATIAIGAIFVLAIVFCAALAFHAGTLGYRIGFIAAAIEIALFGAWLLYFSPFR